MPLRSLLYFGDTAVVIEVGECLIHTFFCFLRKKENE